MRARSSVALTTLLLAACSRSEPAPEPTFAETFPAVTVPLSTFSSPTLIDLDGDSVPDVVFGSGRDRTVPAGDHYVFSREPAIPGYVTAVSGATNELLWQAPHTGDAHTIPRFADLNRDGIPDVVMGGREAAFAAFSGRDGAPLWRVARAALPTTVQPYNFFTPAVVADLSDDGVPDLIVVYGGDDTVLPGKPRAAAYLLVVSGADGAILASPQTPDARESYAGMVVYRRSDGNDWIVFGTGGETHGGGAYRAPVTTLLDGSFAARVEPLVTPGEKGVMAPPTLVELDGDGELDIVVSTFDGRLIAVSGATRQILWEHRTQGEESYHQPAVVRMTRDGRLGLLVSFGIGIFPQYTGSVHRLHDAANGKVLYQYSDSVSPGGAPLAVDISGDGIDELFFFSVHYPRKAGGRIHILHAPSKTLIAHDLPTNFTATPVIADPRGTGTLELIGISWEILPGEGTPTWRDLRTHLLRLDLNARTPPFLAWSQYMGTGADGQYRLPAASARQ